MNSREIVRRTILFQNPERLAFDLPDGYGSDIVWADMCPSPDARPKSGKDEWGALWENIGVSNLGEVKEFPLKNWADFERLDIPDVTDPKRWEHLAEIRDNHPDKFIIGNGISIYERVHFLRGLENTWMDIYESPQKLRELLGALVEMNLMAIERYAALGFDGYCFCDDWGLQDRLMIPPEKWRQLWKPFYKHIYDAAHKAGLLTILHSCGYIVDILDDLIEIGLNVVHMDQQENMGLKLLGDRFAGRITFFSCVDIQNTMVYGSSEDIHAYCHKMAELLGCSRGGFIARWYKDPVGAGHSRKALDAMCTEFLRMSKRRCSACSQITEVPAVRGAKKPRLIPVR